MHPDTVTGFVSVDAGKDVFRIMDEEWIDSSPAESKFLFLCFP